MRVERIQPPDLLDSAARLQYAQAVRVDRFLFVSGQTGMDAAMRVPESYEAECRQLFENLKKVLAAAGCGFGDVVEGLSLHTPGSDLATFWRIRNEYFREPWPAWTLIGDIALALPTLHAEVKVTAVIPS